ncbi:MAG TPA: vWA domain-containing protein [Tetrasphaera sp.]|uniref:vWA domain-containing protein n=1 Tax=Nostocoides sp. TaxID=1917966 RepID=UPI002C68FEA4|nr:vWA domain-containing protein [Tetrasphaera sp.]HNQ06395.1 vWA domain-containing protein [Tetrasphaera sp.]
MTDSTLTHLYFLLDRSGSMQSIKTDTEGGFAAFIAEQRNAAGRCRVTLAQFDNAYEVVYADLDVALVEPLTLQPRGTTALLDAIGRLVTEAGQSLARLPEAERPGTVVVAIMTDGLENASKEWTHAAVKALIEQQERDYLWQFLYMGADQDAIEVGARIGVAAANSLTYARGAVAPAMAAASSMVGELRTARRHSADAALRGYSEKERRDSAG